MFEGREPCSRRGFLSCSAGAAIAFAPRRAEAAPVDPAAEDKALIAITLDLEMSRNFPTWDQTHWDYEKGNLDGPTKRYAVEACRRVKARGGVIHCFVVGRVFEQEDVTWLKAIVRAGHPVGNHTYDHVNVLAKKPEELQYRFQRAPWLIQGQTPRDVIAENIRMTTMALKERVGVQDVGFRTPGGFTDGLVGRPDVQQLVRDAGFRWVSSKYPIHPLGRVGEAPSEDVYQGIVAAGVHAQPFEYPSGLVEIPMSPISDVTAFRAGRWKLEHFLRAVRAGVLWAVEHRAVYDFLGHPSCLVIADPQFRAIELICDLVASAGGRAVLADLETIYRRVKLRSGDRQWAEKGPQ